jgi:hypothetical protein
MSDLRQFLTKISKLNPDAGEIGDGMLHYLVETATNLLDAPDYADELEAVMHIRKCSHCQAFQGCPCGDILDVGCAYHRIKYAKAQARKA